MLKMRNAKEIERFFVGKGRIVRVEVEDDDCERADYVKFYVVSKCGSKCSCYSFFVTYESGEPVFNDDKIRTVTI
jgi:hypothetical protein